MAWMTVNEQRQTRMKSMLPLRPGVVIQQQLVNTSIRQLTVAVQQYQDTQ